MATGTTEFRTASLRPTSPPPLPPTPAAEVDAESDTSPLTDEHFRLICEAARRRQPIRSAARTAKASGMVTLVIGLLAVPFVLLSFSFVALVVAVGICVVGLTELKGRRLMAEADPAAASFLSRNQLVFLGLIIFYCVVQMAAFSPAEAKAAAISPEFRANLAMMPDMIAKIDGLIEQWSALLIYGFYGLVIFLSVLMQGGMAWYYASRRKFVSAYIDQTPPWVRRVLQEAGS